MDEIKEYFVHEFLDEYRARRMDRRAMLKRVTLILGGATSAAAWLQAQGEPVSAAEAAQSVLFQVPTEQRGSAVTVSPDDPAIVDAGAVEYPGRDGATLFGYAVRPAALAVAPAVMIVHANGGLQEHHRDVARRFAKEGFAALAIDLVSREGGTAAQADQPSVSAALSAAGSVRHVGDMLAAIDYMHTLPYMAQQGVGVTGYCFGGSQTWRIAVEDTRVAAAVPYYGSAPPLEKVPDMRAAVHGVYASDDERVNSTAVPLEEALRTHGKTYAMKYYPETRHGFFGDTSQVYAPDQAREAWADTLAWFRQYIPTA